MNAACRDFGSMPLRTKARPGAAAAFASWYASSVADMPDGWKAPQRAPRISTVRSLSRTPRHGRYRAPRHGTRSAGYWRDAEVLGAPRLMAQTTGRRPRCLALRLKAPDQGAGEDLHRCGRRHAARDHAHLEQAAQVWPAPVGRAEALPQGIHHARRVRSVGKTRRNSSSIRYVLGTETCRRSAYVSAVGSPYRSSAR